VSFSVETVETLKQHYILVPSHVREVYLYHLLCYPPESILHLRRDPPVTGKPSKSKRKAPNGAADEADRPPKQPPPTIIFVRHPRTAAYLTTLLQHLDIRATALHSHLSQPARLASLQLFRASVVPVLVCTDVASRGLDMDDVGMVINWDMPSGKIKKRGKDIDTPSGAADANAEHEDVGGAEEYVHRVGRTARMGRGGVAVSFVTERAEDERMVQKIEQRIR
jgi:ATP-dependent RNA helicase DDX49/DBP8